ncbi:hypothetical protein ADUPG1_011383 [Aduncisulcus paluster]|uniref:Uncharacterized protein n=1 Tax=Aduncisulcus paluster TaxID=2918883 RepID=A0ABQ5JVG3_9EUKA|nr:hypothetical protein ADUPG1_011383 [Aduncisulcus paluster]
MVESNPQSPVITRMSKLRHNREEGSFELSVASGGPFKPEPVSMSQSRSPLVIDSSHIAPLVQHSILQKTQASIHHPMLVPFSPHQLTQHMSYSSHSPLSRYHGQPEGEMFEGEKKRDEVTQRHMTSEIPPVHPTHTQGISTNGQQLEQREQQIDNQDVAAPSTPTLPQSRQLSDTFHLHQLMKPSSQSLMIKPSSISLDTVVKEKEDKEKESVSEEKSEDQQAIDDKIDRYYYDKSSVSRDKSGVHRLEPVYQTRREDDSTHIKRSSDQQIPSSSSIMPTHHSIFPLSTPFRQSISTESIDIQDLSGTRASILPPQRSSIQHEFPQSRIDYDDSVSTAALILQQQRHKPAKRGKKSGSRRSKSVGRKKRVVAVPPQYIDMTQPPKVVFSHDEDSASLVIPDTDFTNVFVKGGQAFISPPKVVFSHDEDSASLVIPDTDFTNVFVKGGQAFISVKRENPKKMDITVKRTKPKQSRSTSATCLRRMRERAEKTVKRRKYK